MEQEAIPATPAASAPGRREPRYRAFLSYSHRDRKWARWLLRQLEGYRVPRRLVGQEGRFGPVVRRLAPIFRDRDELAADSNLSEGIRAALEDSAALILIASPASAGSRWVNEEILTYKRLGREGRVFAFIVDGDPGEIDGEQACLPPALRFRMGGNGELTDEVVEPMAADARPIGDGRKRAVRKLIAGLIGVPYDALRRREAQRRNRRLAVITGASLVGMAVTVGLAIFAFLAREDAERRRTQAEDLLGFMVGDLRESLEPVGRLDLLDKVGDKAMDYFLSAQSGDLTDEGLARQALALTQIGEVRLSQARYDDALASFKQAHQWSVELLQRNPGDGRRLFDRGQAEFWVGYVAWQRRDVGNARVWFTRYLETSRVLARKDPANEDWALELTYAQHNLAVLELESGDLDRAAETFADQKTFLEHLDCDSPSCDKIKYDLADAVTWQGLTALEMGRIEDAYRFFLAARGSYSDLLARKHDDRMIQFEYADESGNAGLAAYWLGHSEDAYPLLQETRAMRTELVRHDPDNLSWREHNASIGLILAQFLLSSERHDDAAVLIAGAASDLELVVAREPSNFGAAQKLARADRLRASLLLSANEPRSALASCNAALERLTLMTEPGVGAESIDAERAMTLIVLGEVHQAMGERTTARRHWLKALDLVGRRLERSLHPRLAEPYVRAHHLLDEEDSTMIKRIRATGLASPGLWRDSGQNLP